MAVLNILRCATFIPGGLTTVLMLSVVLFFAIYFYSSKPKSLPPGPWGLPVVGCLPYLRLAKNKNQTIQSYGKKYGDVWSMRLGSQLVVVLNTYEMMKEAFINQADHTSFRPISENLSDVINGRGIIHSNGRVWKEQRKFTGKSLRGFGMGSKIIEEKIVAEVQATICQIESLKQQPFKPNRYLQWVSANVITSIVYNRHFDFDDKEFHRLMDNLYEMCVQGGDQLNPGIFMPVLKIFPFVRKKCDQVLNGAMFIIKWCEEQVKEHRKTYDENSCSRDYIDDYIREQKQQQQALGSQSTFTDDEFYKTLFDLLVAGIETVSTTFTWYLLHLAMRQELQRKIQEEIDDVLGKDRAPSYDDRKHMPYTEAFCYDAQRVANIGLFAFRRQATKDIKINGYQIPAGSTIFANFYNIHEDPKHWPEPKTIKPERWLDKDGQLSLKNDGFVPFSIGRRNCIGEALGKMELFLLTVIFLQRFNIGLPEGAPMPNPDDFEFGMTFIPRSFKIVAVPR